MDESLSSGGECERDQAIIESFHEEFSRDQPMSLGILGVILYLIAHDESKIIVF